MIEISSIIVWLLSSLNPVDLSNTSMITAVKSVEPTGKSLEMQEKEVEQYLISLCKKVSESKHPPPEPLKACDVKEFDDLAHRQFPIALSLSIEELIPIIIGNDRLLTQFTRAEVFQAVLSDMPLLREILFSSPQFNKFLLVNPGLRTILENDDTFRRIFSIVITPSSVLKIGKREAVCKLIEPLLGHPVVITPELVATENWD